MLVEKTVIVELGESRPSTFIFDDTLIDETLNEMYTIYFI